MPAFDHLLLTRFSAVLTPGAPPAPEEWLRYRLAFFYDAALPSVAAQEDATFEWLVLFDDRCPDAFRHDVEDLAADGAFTPLWSHDTFRRDSFAGVAARTARSPHLITTRMDSDDAIARDFMASVQQQFDGQEQLFVNFVTGLQVDRSGAVYRSDQVSSPFLSLIERRTVAPPRTVYAPKHARARSAGPLRQVFADPMWLQVVHGSNLSNIVNGARVAPSVVDRRFTLHLGYSRDLSGAPMIRARVRQRTSLLRLWFDHPGELVTHAEARATRLRGIHTVPQRVDTLSDRVRRFAIRRGYRPRRP